MHKFFVLPILTALCIVLTAAFGFPEQESLTISTYYPSPYGVYGVLRLSPRQKNQSVACQTGEMYYEQGPANPAGLYFCNSTNGWEQVGSRFQSSPKVEFGGMYENGESKWGASGSKNCNNKYSFGSSNETRCPCCESGNIFNESGSCGCPAGFTSFCMEMTDEPTDELDPAGPRHRYEEYCYCYKQN